MMMTIIWSRLFEVDVTIERVCSTPAREPAEGALSLRTQPGSPTRERLRLRIPVLTKRSGQALLQRRLWPLEGTGKEAGGHLLSPKNCDDLNFKTLNQSCPVRSELSSRGRNPGFLPALLPPHTWCPHLIPPCCSQKFLWSRPHLPTDRVTA